MTLHRLRRWAHAFFRSVFAAHEVFIIGLVSLGASVAFAPEPWRSLPVPWLVMAAGVDAAIMILPNPLLLAASLSAIGGWILSDSSAFGALATGIGAGLIGWVMARAHWWGMGDAKLMIAVGMWLGHPMSVALALMVGTLAACAGAILTKARWNTPVPLGPGIVAGAWTVFAIGW
ncbi:MAG: A24 family peptidase [Ancrocorticia sp.]|jgi:prepilin signal peptidase PulO-like enzyme (type II secretory pathway)|nr:A24 family peptidase [Ancrocorticia sp.]MCI1895823.1 A24 family peptidase [Ancrocorticia sp.]MCI1932647.1 A24 family peptidase [Ancrocorticia sp.]MCI1964292.1 A24 family peptidase [Ancrocorticia sp.]MCI2002895.1 A24 family peptidase [Ancrocorticia sp.]